MNNNENRSFNNSNNINPNHQSANNINSQSQINNGINLDPQYQQENNIGNNQQTQVSNNSNLNLLQFFIGDNYDKITTRNFSFAGAFFGGLYFLYRKMYLYGIIFYSLTCFLTFIGLDIFILIPCSIVMIVLQGMFTNKLYINYAKKKVETIVSQNPDCTQNDIAMICTKQGGKNGIFKVLLIAIIVSICINFIISKLNLKQNNSNQLQIFSFLKSDNNKTNGNSDSNDKNTTIDNNKKTDSEESDIDNYDNWETDGYILYYSDEKISDSFTMTIPNVFISESSKNNDYSEKHVYKTNGDGVFNECSVSFNAITNYTSAEKFLKKLSWYKNSEEKFDYMDINNLTWYGFATEEMFGTTYYLGTTKNDKVYLIEYIIESEANQSACGSYLDTIMYSIYSK